MPAEVAVAAAVTEDLHAWEAGGAASAEALSAWVGARLAAHEAALAALLAVEGPRTLENSLRLYDAAIEQLSLAGAQAGVLNSVAADKAVRDQAQMEAQRVAMAGSALSLNREVYDALVAIEPRRRQSPPPATTSSAPCSATVWPASTRTRPPAIASRRCTKRPPRTSLEFSRNIQEGAQDHRRHACRTRRSARRLPRPPPGRRRRQRHAHHRPARHAAGHDLCRRMPLCASACSWPTTPAPIRRTKQILLDLLATRQEIATVLGFRSWADLATADQMMGSAANVRTFLAKLDEASREGAVREHELVLDFARRRQPGIEGHRHHQPRLLVRAVPPLRLRLRFAIRAPLLSLRAGRSRRASTPPRASSRSSFAVTEPGMGPRGLASSTSLKTARIVGRFYLDMHPREGKRQVVLRCARRHRRARTLPARGRAHLQLSPAAMTNDPGLLQYSDVVTFFHEFGHLMHAILGGQHRVGRPLRICHRRRLHRSSIADARRILPRRKTAAGLRQALSKPAKSCPPRPSRR